MYNPACYSLKYALCVCDSSPLANGGTEWSEEEIATVRAVLHKLTSIRILDSSDAEDLVQETLLTMITKHPGVQLEKGLLAWTLGILRRKVGNYYRRIRRCNSFSYEGDLPCKDPDADSPEMKLLYCEMDGIVQETLALLPPPQRRAVELMLSGLQSREIAKELYPENYQTVITHIHRGRKRLAKELTKYGYGPDFKPGMTKMIRSTPKRR